MKLNLKVKYIVCLAVLSFIKVKLIDCHTYRNRNGTIYAKHLQPETVENENEPTDLYTFVALIEIMFNDGSKKNCTGAIIHDNVVVTAAHCFVERDSALLQPELTGSFVIIGSKNMFVSGYEQYLPIERIVVHPNYTGWTSDLALVFTFSGMMSDKPGNILPLADGNSFTSVHSNVTVLSWNPRKEKDVTTTTKISHSDSCSELSEEEKSGHFTNEVTRPYMTKAIIYISSNENTPATNNQQSNLYTDDYTIIDVQICKQLVQKLKPAIYQIQNENETICYSKTKPFNINGESGAPSIHRNHLVTVAAGEILRDTEHIIIGTKISCFCNWIIENLPSGGDHLNCCKDCCNIVDI